MDSGKRPNPQKANVSGGEPDWDSLTSVRPDDRFVPPSDAPPAAPVQLPPVPRREMVQAIESGSEPFDAPAASFPAPTSDVTVRDSRDDDPSTSPPHPSAARPTRVPESPSDSRRSGDFVPTVPMRIPGTTADFVLRERIGRGGQGDVWRAVQSSLDREVALKLLRLDKNEPDDVLAFLQEAYVNAELDHPNIVPVYELGRSSIGGKDCHMLAMKLVRGRSWHQVIEEDRASPDFQLENFLGRHLQILLSVCNAVAYAHSKRIIHRDLKPKQVVLGAFGEVFLLDWGLAVSMEDGQRRISGDDIPKYRTLATATNCTGTPAYMAPEQTRGATASLGYHTDIYLLGAILFELVTGAPPHMAGTAVEAYARAIRNEFDPVPDDCPTELRYILMRALATDVSDRFESVDQFRNEVEGYISGSTRRRDSIELTRKAEAALDTDSAQGGYAAFGEAAALLGQAISLWPTNMHARALRRRVSVEHARRALQANDLSLARSLALNVEDAPSRDTLLRGVERQETEARNAELQRRRLRRSTVTLAATVGCLLVALLVYLVRVERAETERFRAEAADAEGRRRLLVRTLELEEKAAGEAANRIIAERSAALQSTLAEDLRRAAAQRDEEATLAEEFSAAFPPPQGLQPSDDSGPQVTGAAAEVLMQRRAALRERRVRLSDNIVVASALGAEPFELTLADANRLLRDATGTSEALAAYDLYLRAAVERPDAPEPHRGLGVAAARAGHLTSATMHLAEASSRLRRRRGANHPDVADALSLEASAWRSLDSTRADFHALSEQSIAILEPQLAELSITLADRWLDAGEAQRALDYSSQTLALQTRLHGPDSREAGDATGMVGSVLLRMGEYRRAEAMFRRALEIREASAPQDTDAIAVALNNLAIALRYQGETPEAERLHRRALDLRRSLHGERHRTVAGSMSNLAVTLERMGRAQEALELQQEALRIRTELFGPDHPETINSYLNVASAIEELYDSPERTKEAEALIRRALEGQRRTFGADSPESATALHNLALNLMEQERMEEAEEMLVASIAVLERTRGSNHPSLAAAQLNLGALFERTGRFADAETRYRAALDVRLRAFDRRTVPVASVMGRLGSVIHAQGRSAEAIPLMEEAVEVQRRRPDGRGAPPSLLYDLGRAYFDADRAADAVAPLREAIATSRRVLPGSYAHEANAVVALGASLMELGRYSEALAAADELHSLAGATGDAGEEVVAMMDLARATILRRLERYPEATRAAASSARMRLRRFGPDAPPTLQALAVLGVIRADAGDTTNSIGLLSAVWIAQSARPAGAAAPESLSLRSLAGAFALEESLDERTRQHAHAAVGHRLAELVAEMRWVTRRDATEEILGAQRAAVEAWSSLGERGTTDARRELLRAITLTDSLDLPTTHSVRLRFLAPQVQALGVAREAVLVKPRALWAEGKVPSSAEVNALLDAAAPAAEWSRSPARSTDLPRLLAPLAFDAAQIEALLPALASGEDRALR